MSAVEKIEAELNKARSELAAAQAKLATATARAKELNDQRAPLLRAATVQNDDRAAKALTRLTDERLAVVQECDDLGYVIADIEREILHLEREYESARRESDYDRLRALMAARNQVAERVQAQVEKLAKLINEYVRASDDLSNLAHGLQIPNANSRALLGTPLLKDFVSYRFKFLFPTEFGFAQASQRVELIDAERSAGEALEFAITSAAARRAA